MRIAIGKEPVEVDVSASHVIVGIFIVVYSSVDPINTPCSSCPSCHSTGYEPGCLAFISGLSVLFMLI